ncbi:hypothetical protein J2Z23_004530 [Lederbergia galactosidilyticus]|uniref:hypothetical protein n=1 Tax=Lederbergia galactosidilytica TaxID=217031 RepID=UPI001AE1A328|nr:hypothetical protein [Lederbergia galactosidilytica]MBP1917524.1 hypothetical protein [Lederbergia galactosidilytica]
MNKMKDYTRTFKETGMYIPIKTNEAPTKQAKVSFGKVTESIATKKVRERNERIIEWLQLNKNGRYGLLHLFGRCQG